MSKGLRNWRLYESYRKLLFNLSFREAPHLIQAKESKLSNLNKKIRSKSIINLKRYESHGNAKGLESHYNYILLDFEGDTPVKLLGLYFNSCTYSYLLNAPDPTSRGIENFYKGISDVLSLFQGFLIFGFTFWDYKIIQSMGQSTINRPPALEDVLYFNLQSRDRESVSEALYSIGEELPRDPLYRSNRKINQLHEDGFFDIIRKHNRSCIEAELTILQKRFLPQKLIDPTLGIRGVSEEE